MMDINSEVMKAGAIMTRYRIPREDQIEIVRTLMAAGVEHCLQEQEKLRSGKNAMIDRAQRVH